MDNENHNETEEKQSFNAKIIITAVVSVLLCAAFVLSLITFGMNAQRKFDNQNAEQRAKDKIVEVKAVDYEVEYFNYSTGEIYPGNTRTLLDKLGAQKGQNYYVINSQDKLDAVLDATGHSGGYSVPAEFFKSSSIVAIPYEHAGLSGLKVKGVTRDEDYNITASLSYADAFEIENIMGIVALVKLQNIQPKLVTATVDMMLPGVDY